MIEKLQKRDGGTHPYIDDEGCSWSDKKSYLQINVLNFCGCGDPDGAMVFVGDILKLMEDHNWYSAELNKLLPDERSRYFVLYMLDHLGLTEHGTSINCSWLTDRGKEVLTDIEWCIENEEEEE